MLSFKASYTTYHPSTQKKALRAIESSGSPQFLTDQSNVVQGVYHDYAISKYSVPGYFQPIYKDEQCVNPQSDNCWVVGSGISVEDIGVKGMRFCDSDPYIKVNDGFLIETCVLPGTLKIADQNHQKLSVPNHGCDGVEYKVLLDNQPLHELSEQDVKQIFGGVLRFQDGSRPSLL